MEEQTMESLYLIIKKKWDIIYKKEVMEKD